MKILTPKLNMYPFVHENTRWLTMSSLNEKGTQLAVNVLSELLSQVGYETFKKFLFELKFPPKPPV